MSITEPDEDPRRDDREDFGYWQRLYRREPALKARVLDGHPALKPGWFRLAAVDGKLRVVRGPKSCGYLLFVRLDCTLTTTLRVNRTLHALLHAEEAMPELPPEAHRVIRRQKAYGYRYLCRLATPAIYKIEFQSWGGSTLFWYDGGGEVNPGDFTAPLRREGFLRS